MSFELPSVHRRVHEPPAWQGFAIVIEAMVLLAFLAASLAVITQLFAASAVRAGQGRELAAAVSCATNVAERFATHPDEAEGTTREGNLTVVCDVHEDQHDAGTLYHATITVFESDAETPVYVLETARYVGQVR